MKVVFFGDSGVGKTTIINSFQSSPKAVEPTISASSINLSVKTDDQDVDLNIWDTAGQDAFQAVAPQYAHGAKAVVFVFALNDKSTFDNLESWYEILTNSISPTSTKMFIVGNKSDLQHVVTNDEITQYCEEKGIPYSEVSAKTNFGTNELLNSIANSLKDASFEMPEKVDFNQTNTKTDGGCSC
ncbi:ras-related protein Rab7 [Histomonas meleagridis]|uniref:ras-related protein Rab7 n=1 Tax=Histomonas meleagridis TaxID=135588 RepID=UPI00355A11CA|nr:ras-related protein Rab7 [Histomonas meleagridis]KAH0805462.1 ras-related protein Rab7 [Histomonas meleagridis]